MAVGKPKQILCFDSVIAKMVETQVSRYFDFFNTEKNNPIVFDIGANIGLFTLAALDRFPAASIFGYEISPITHAVYTLNTAQWLDQVRCFNVGLADIEGQETLYHYPLMPAISSLEESIDPSEVTATIHFLLSADKSGMGRFINPLPKFLKTRMVDFVASRYLQNPISMSGQTTILSKQIEQLGVRRIDMLKIDVEGAEERVLNGIKPQHWRMIDQVAIEVHDINDRIDRVRLLLQSQGFDIHIFPQGFDMKRRQIVMLTAKQVETI